jgi:RNA polymerase sigma factor (sigma-70 family)
MVHILDGAGKYQIDSLESWVWRVAHNRYARFIKAKVKRNEVSSDEELFDVADDYDFIDSIAVTDEYEIVFLYLHTLSAEYKNITVDYYIGGMPVKQLCEKYSLPESTIKWRLNISRQKIRDRIGENKMDKVYKRINWNTTCCNGSMNSNKYLYSQISRAVCESAYEKPLTVEEISLKTGLPTMYIEDELPRLIDGDAIIKEGSKYVTNFIILRLCDKKIMETKFAPFVGYIADYFEEVFNNCNDKIKKMQFYGTDYGITRLGYIAVPACLRGKVKNIKDSIEGLSDGKFPPRQDGGYGWFIIMETKDETEQLDEYDSGCNITGDDENLIYYYHLRKYFNPDIYHNGGTRWLAANKIPQKSQNGIIPDGLLTEDDIVRLLNMNLIVKADGSYKLNFACYTGEEYTSFISLFKRNDEELDLLLKNLILDIHRCFKVFVPKRLDSQINQWVSCYVHSIIGFVTEELISRGVLEKPDDEKPLTNGVFYISGKYIDL